MYLILAGLGFAVFGFSCVVPPGMVALKLATIGCAIFNLGAYAHIVRVDQHYWSYKFFAFYFLLQPIVATVLLFAFPYPMERFFHATSLLSQAPVSVFYSCSLVVLLALIFALVVNASHRSKDSNLRKYLHVSDGGLSVLLVFAALVSLSIWFHNVLPGPIGYGARILHRAFELMPLLAGMYFWKSKLVRNSWITSLSLSLIFAFFTGSRGYFFYPAAFFCVGYFIQEKRLRARIALIALAVVGLVPGLMMVGFIGQLRQELGRKSLQEVDFSMIIRNIDVVIDRSFGNTLAGVKNEKDNALYTGLSRLMDMTVWLVPNMSPKPVEYRTYGDIALELRELYSISGMNRGSGYVYPSRLVPNNYGIGTYIQMDYSGNFQSFTVPFNVLPDSWSRRGLISSIFQVSFAILFFAIVERIHARFFRRFAGVYVAGQFVLIGLAFRYMTAYTLIATVRQVIMTYTLCMIVFLSISYLSKRFIPRLMGDENQRAPLPTSRRSIR